MLDQNTDRMWYVIGAVIIGGLILTSSIVLFTDVAFAGVQDAFTMFSNMVDVNEIPDYYVLATDDDFEWRMDAYTDSEYEMYTAKNEDGLGYYYYTGSDKYVIIPEYINGHRLDSYYQMFYTGNNGIRGVASTHKGIKSMRSMLGANQFNELDLTYLSTEGVVDMRHMFGGGFSIDILDLSNFNFESVENTIRMFVNSKINIVYVNSKTDAEFLRESEQVPKDIKFIVK